jgi:hypothetical protein
MMRFGNMASFSKMPIFAALALCVLEEEERLWSDIVDCSSTTLWLYIWQQQRNK